MAMLVRIGVGVLVRGGAVFGAFVLVSPAIWSRSDFDGFEYGVAVAVVGGWGVVGRKTRPLGRWVRDEVLFSIGFAATAVAGYVLIGALFGESTLSSMPQRIAFGTAAAVSVCFWVGLHFAVRMPAFTDPDGESRRAAIRANIRREIEEIERAAGGETGTARPDEH